MNFSEFANRGVKETKVNKDVMEAYEELKDLNDDELSKRLFEEVSAQKSNGTFNYDMLLNSVESIKTYLPPENYENIKRILNTLK